MRQKDRDWVQFHVAWKLNGAKHDVAEDIQNNFREAWAQINFLTKKTKMLEGQLSALLEHLGVIVHLRPIQPEKYVAIERKECRRKEKK